MFETFSKAKDLSGMRDEIKLEPITANNPPRFVFIVPYRDREPQKFFFENYMTYLMEEYEEGREYLLYFIEQGDSRPFNRGAMKNIGFAAVRDLYPDTYRDITFIFNDIDVVPYKKDVLRLDVAQPGVIGHHYGFRFALGGIVSITGADFERLNGFANYWSWGFEDNLLQNRAQRAGIRIDRSNFFELNDMRIIHVNDGNNKTLNRNYMYELVLDKGDNGLRTVSNLEYRIDESTRTVRVVCFDVEYSPWQGKFEKYDVRNGRDLQAPISKEMMLANARNGNNLDTLYFIDENGEKKKPSQMLHEDKTVAEMAARSAEARHSQFMKSKGGGIMMNANNLRQLQRDNAKPKPASSGASVAAQPTRVWHSPQLVMSGVKRAELNNARNMQEQLKERQRNQQRMMHGRLGISR